MNELVTSLTIYKQLTSQYICQFWEMIMFFVECYIKQDFCHYNEPYPTLPFTPNADVATWGALLQHYVIFSELSANFKWTSNYQPP